MASARSTPATSHTITSGSTRITRLDQGESMGKRLKESLAQGKLVRVFGMGQLCHPKIVEIIGQHGGYDAVWLDQEHAALSIGQIEHACLAARAVGIDTF